MNEQQRIITIGGSAGSMEPLIQIIASLEPQQNASVFVALHGSGESSTKVLQKKLSQKGSMRIDFAKDGEAIEPGRVYVASSDRHLMIQRDSIRVSHGPRVNRSRPAIDLLFRSAAVAYNVRTIGVILSGLLSDGTAGLAAIQKCGGITVAQDPKDALFGDMPGSAMEATEIDYIKPAAEIGELLNEIVASPAKQNGQIPEEIMLENRLDLNKKTDIPKMDELGERSAIGCPECGGPMWKINGKNRDRYRCHIGHSLDKRSLMDGQNEQIEKTLRVAVRTLEEKMQVQEKLLKSGNGSTKNSGNILQERVNETKSHIDRLRNLILDM